MASHIADGKWHAILANFGVSDHQLSGRDTDCPICGGKDRFRYDNKEGRGTYFCRGCGPGDGYILVQKIKGYETFKQAADEVEKFLGVHPEIKANKHRTERTPVEIRANLQRLWEDATVDIGGINEYLDRRGLMSVDNSALHRVARYHPALQWTEKTNSSTDRGVCPGILLRVFNPGHKPVTLHRTYLSEKPGPRKKLMKGTETLKGCYVPLGGLPRAIGDGGLGMLGISEGFENAIAARQWMRGGRKQLDFPVWSTVAEQHLRAFRAPPGVDTLLIFGDHDESFIGQCAAYECAYHNTKAGVTCHVAIPRPRDGARSWDWNDEVVYLSRSKGKDARRA